MKVKSIPSPIRVCDHPPLSPRISRPTGAASCDVKGEAPHAFAPRPSTAPMTGPRPFDVPVGPRQPKWPGRPGTASGGRTARRAGLCRNSDPNPAIWRPDLNRRVHDHSADASRTVPSTDHASVPCPVEDPLRKDNFQVATATRFQINLDRGLPTCIRRAADI